MLLTFCQFSPGHDRQRVEIDPAEVVGLRHGTREVTRGRVTECVNVLVIALADGTEVEVLDAARADALSLRCVAGGGIRCAATKRNSTNRRVGSQRRIPGATL
jgi:hypothetical protein